MARKGKTPIITKKHMARQQREQLQMRYIKMVTLFIVIVVVGLIGYGLLDEFVLQPAKPVVKVGDDKVTIKEFENFASFSGQQTINNYLQNVQLAQMFGYDETYISSLRDQAQAALNIDSLGNQTLNYFIEDLLIRQEAKRRNISVSSDEVDKSLQDQFGYFPNGTPTPRPTFAALPTSTLSATQLAFFPPTSTPTITTPITTTVEVTSTVPTATTVIEATPTETAVATSTIAPTETPELTPTVTFTPTPYTEELFNESYQNVIDEYDQNGIPESTIKFLIESQLYREKVREAILAELNLNPEEEQVWARHILVPDDVTANLVFNLLKDGGNFVELAAIYSTDGSAQSGGDLNWFGRGKMVPEFENAAFSLAIGEISEPVQSSFGYHIIQVLGHEVRSLSESDFNQLENQKFQEWLDTQRESTDVEINDIWREFVPTLNLPAGA